MSSRGGVCFQGRANTICSVNMHRDGNGGENESISGLSCS